MEQGTQLNSYFNCNRGRRAGLFALTALSLLLFFANLGRVPFYNKGEPREGLVVQDIVRHGSWVFPLKEEGEIPSKPPLFHWLASIAAMVSGRVDEMTLRFPSAFLAALTALMLYLFGLRLHGPKAAFLGALVLITTAGFQAQAIQARVDMTLTFFMTLSLILFYSTHAGFLRNPLWSYVFYFVVGLSILAKGPVSVIIPGTVIFVFLSWRGQWDRIRSLGLHPGALIPLAIGLLWYGNALTRGGEEFFWRQIIHENLARFFMYGENGSGHQKPVYYFFPYLVLAGLPWSLLIAFALPGWVRKAGGTGDRFLFPLFWVASIFVFFSLSAGKRPTYLLPLYPPLSLLIAAWLADDAKQKTRTFGLGVVAVASLLSGAIFIGVASLFLWRGDLAASAELASLLKPKDRANLALVERALASAGWWPISLFVCCGALWMLSGVRLFLSRFAAGVGWLACAAALTGFTAQAVVLPAIAEGKSYKTFVQGVERLAGPETLVSVYPAGWDYASVLLYGGGRLRLVRGSAAEVYGEIAKGGFSIMAEAEWRKLAAVGPAMPTPILQSAGAGPDGDERIVLIDATSRRAGGR